MVAEIHGALPAGGVPLLNSLSNWYRIPEAALLFVGDSNAMPARVKSNPLIIILEENAHLAGRTLALPVISAYVWFMHVYYDLPLSKVKAESPRKTTIGKNPTQKYVVL